MLRNILSLVFVVLFFFSSPMAGESKNQWTDKESIQFAEDLFFLLETIIKDAGPNSRVSLDSYTIHGGTIRIMELRFKDDRIIRIEVHRNVAGENSAWLEAHLTGTILFRENTGQVACGGRQGNFGDTLHISTFGIRARSKEHRVNLESEHPERAALVIDIFGGEEYHFADTTYIHHRSLRPGKKENVKM